MQSWTWNTLVATYLVGTTQYRHSTSKEDCRVVIMSTSNALRFLARFQSLFIHLCTSCKHQRLVLIACHLADKDLNQTSKKQHKKECILILSKAAHIIYSKYFITGALIFLTKPTSMTRARTRVNVVLFWTIWTNLTQTK